VKESKGPIWIYEKKFSLKTYGGILPLQEGMVDGNHTNLYKFPEGEGAIVRTVT
jgi:hypothetical protein